MLLLITVRLVLFETLDSNAFYIAICVLIEFVLPVCLIAAYRKLLLQSLDNFRVTFIFENLAFLGLFGFECLQLAVDGWCDVRFYNFQTSRLYGFDKTFEKSAHLTSVNAKFLRNCVKA